ncbi:MAG: leucyl aminopeptidase, partial [Candidatus Nanopelagicales bacterium]
MTTLVLNSADITTIAGDVLVVATVPAGGRKKGAVLAGPAAGLKAAPTRKLEEALAALGATGKAGDVVREP